MQTIKKILQPYTVYVKRFFILLVVALAFSVGVSVRITAHYRANPVTITQTVEKLVEASRPFPSVLSRIMLAESSGKHMRSGQVLIMPILTGKYAGTYDIGIMQINSMHNEAATKLGYNLMVEKDNIAFALHLYDTQGTEPWSASIKNWR